MIPTKVFYVHRVVHDLDIAPAAIFSCAAVQHFGMISVEIWDVEFS